MNKWIIMYVHAKLYSIMSIFWNGIQTLYSKSQTCCVRCMTTRRIDEKYVDIFPLASALLEFDPICLHQRMNVKCNYSCHSDCSQSNCEYGHGPNWITISNTVLARECVRDFYLYRMQCARSTCAILMRMLFCTAFRYSCATQIH